MLYYYYYYLVELGVRRLPVFSSMQRNIWYRGYGVFFFYSFFILPFSNSPPPSNDDRGGAVWRLSHLAVAYNMDSSYPLGTVHAFTRIITMLTVLPPFQRQMQASRQASA